MSHTKGPWESYGTLVYFSSAGGIDTHGAPDAEDNARLIAAAPELLEALEGLIDNERQSSFEYWLSIKRPSGDCDSVHSQWLESSEYDDFLDLYGDEIAAIAKARGQQ